MIISVDAISTNFRLYEPENNRWVDRDDLLEFINFWKIVFVEKNGLKTGDKIGLGFPLTDIYYFSALYAAAELGLKLVVLDISNNTKNVLPEKSQVQDFFPLDLFISGKGLDLDKHEYYQSLSLQTEYWHIWDQYQFQNSMDYKSIIKRMPDQNDILLLCTSSGTTNRPKKVSHTHNFLYSISKRNRDLFRFDGRVLHVRNLHHGSSLAVFFLPSLMSDACTGHYTFNYESDDSIHELVDVCYRYQINHLQFPYTHALDSFLRHAVEKGIVFDNLTLYTLSYINPEWQILIKQCGVQQIISIFGCNETSGPLFTNCLTPDSLEFDPTNFIKRDEFYDYKFNDTRQLLVYLKEYNQTVVMQDSFNCSGNQYHHLGRNDLIRINDIQVDFFWLLMLCQTQKISAQIVVDRERERLYLAVWDNTDLNDLTQQLNSQIKDRYGSTVQISQAKHLVYQDYLLGIKLNHECLRNFFRKEDYEQTSTP